MRKEKENKQNSLSSILTRIMMLCARIARAILLLSVKITESGLRFFLFSFSFLFYFRFIFHCFYFQNSGLGLKVICHTVTSVTSDGVVTTLIMELKRREQKVLEQSDIIQHGYHMLASCFTHGHLGQGAQQLAWTICRSI